MENTEERFTSQNKIDFLDYNKKKRKGEYDANTFRKLRLAIEHSSPEHIDEDKNFKKIVTGLKSTLNDQRKLLKPVNSEAPDDQEAYFTKRINSIGVTQNPPI
jgi:hypothetical protein